MDYFAAPAASSTTATASGLPLPVSTTFDLSAPVWRVPFAEPLALALVSTTIARQAATTGFKVAQHGMSQLDMRHLSKKLSWGQHALAVAKAFVPVMPAKGSVLSTAVYLAAYETVRTDVFAPWGGRWATNWAAPMAGGAAGAAGYMLASVLPSIVRQGAEVQLLREAVEASAPTKAAASTAPLMKGGKKVSAAAAKTAAAAASATPASISLSIPLSVHAFGMLTAATNRALLFGLYSALVDDRSVVRRAAASRTKAEEREWVEAGGPARGNRFFGFFGRLSAAFLTANIAAFASLPFERVRSVSIASLAVSRRFGSPTQSPVAHWRALTGRFGTTELFKGGSMIPVRAIPTALTVIAFDYTREAYLSSQLSNAHKESWIPPVF